MICFIVVCFVSFILTDAQVPQPCTSPPQWEGRIHTYNRHLDAELTGRLSYDSVYRRTRVLQDTKVGQTETLYDIITLYDIHISFYIDLKTGRCARLRNDEIWRDYGIQSDATFLGEAYLGSSALPDASLLVTRWSGNESRPINQTANYVATWTYNGCLPTFDITFEPLGSIDFRFFYDITLGIKDPSVFIPPSQCFTNPQSTLFFSAQKYSRKPINT